jgi:hypothetical protein
MTPELVASTCSAHSPLGDDGLPWRFDNRWCSESVVLLAVGIHADQAFDRLPILADALEEAGCDDEVILAHCRQCSGHDPECWVVRYALEGDLVTHLEQIADPFEDYVPAPAIEMRPVPVFMKVILWSFGIAIAGFVLFVGCSGIVSFIRNGWRPGKP